MFLMLTNKIIKHFIILRCVPKFQNFTHIKTLALPFCNLSLWHLVMKIISPKLTDLPI